MIEVDSLSVAFASRGVLALRDVSLHVGTGERVALVGSSGSGKTTLLRVLLAVIQPTGGTVRIRGIEPGRSRHHAQSVRRTTGTIRQGDDLVRGLPARVNIAMGALSEWRLLDWPGLLLGRSPTPLATRIEDLAARHGIRDCLDARIESLSGGQRQRVAVCRALIGRPSLILADEPTTGLDAVTSAAVLDALVEDPTATAVVATHDPSVIDRCDRMIALRGGVIVHDGTMLPSGELARIYGSTPVAGRGPFR